MYSFAVELNTDGSISSRASPYGQGVNVDTNQTQNTSGFISRIPTTNIGSHISRSSPMNFKTTVTLSAIEVRLSLNSALFFKFMLNYSIQQMLKVLLNDWFHRP